MALADPDAAAGSGLDDDDPVDLSFAGPEPVVPTAPWYLRLFDLASAYLPLLMMAVLAAGTWCGVQTRRRTGPSHQPTGRRL